jgi:glycerophosphoryl diester phosphodiesterase
MKALILCFFLSFAPLSTRAAAPIRGGFYEVRPANTVFGSLLHLRSQDRMDENFPGQILKGLRGNFGTAGVITTWFGKGGKAHPYWYVEGSGQSAWLNLQPEADGTLTLKPGQGIPDLHLKFAGTRAPSEAAAGIKTTYMIHRGFSYFPPYNTEAIYPANSLPALRAALEEGYAGFEFDVRVSKDGRFIVSHDENIGVATSCPGYVHEKTIAELEDCYVNASTLIPEVVAIPTPTKVKMVTLERVFAEFADDPRFEHMVVDVKINSDDHLVNAFRDAISPFLNRPDYLAKFLVIVHSDTAIRRMQEIDPWSRYYLEGNLGTEPLDYWPDFFPESYGQARTAHNGISLNVGLGMYLPPLVGIYRLADVWNFSHAYNYTVLGWTVSTWPELAATRSVMPELEFLLTDAPMGLTSALELNDYYRQQPGFSAAEREPQVDSSTPGSGAVGSAAVASPLLVPLAH